MSNFICLTELLLNVQKYSNSVTQHIRTRNLSASVYILSINWYIWSDFEMGQHIFTAEGVGTCYRRNGQQHLFILIYAYGTRFIKWRKNGGGSNILNWGRGTLRFRVLLCSSMSWSIFGCLITTSCKSSSSNVFS